MNEIKKIIKKKKQKKNAMAIMTYDTRLNLGGIQFHYGYYFKLNGFTFNLLELQEFIQACMHCKFISGWKCIAMQSNSD